MTAVPSINLNEVARDAYERGYIPIVVEGKKPFVPKWEQTTRDKALERVSKSASRGTGIGILTGPVGGVVDIVVVDIDTTNYGVETWDWLVRKWGLPDTTQVRTPSGGRHIYFLIDERTKDITNTVRIGGRGIDVRGIGGQVVYPGSPNYAWISQSPPTVMPDWIFSLLWRHQNKIKIEEE